jgi:hypothetical protein
LLLLAFKPLHLGFLIAFWMGGFWCPCCRQLGQ